MLYASIFDYMRGITEDLSFGCNVVCSISFICDVVSVGWIVKNHVVLL